MFITKRLRLTPEESAKFIPKHQDELMQLRLKSRLPLMKAVKDEKDSVKISLSQNKLVDNEIILKQQEIELLKKYNRDTKEFMSLTKVARLQEVEEMLVPEQLNASIRKEERNNRRPHERPFIPPSAPPEPK